MKESALKIFVIAAVLFVIFVSYQAGNRNGQNDMLKSNLLMTQQALEEYKKESIRLNQIALEVQEKVGALSVENKKTVTEYITHVKEVPLPNECRIDLDRLRLINNAIAAANAAIASEPGAKVPTD